jgi:phosphoribosyl 1,2-cyclic phosphodiesterase
VRVIVLGSGSAGNALVLEDGTSRVLVDAGFAPRVLAGRLRAAGIAPASVEACVVTHEHTDHARGAAAAASRWGWTLVASRGTIEACPDLRRAGATVCRPGTPFIVGGWHFDAARVSHDASEPLAFAATARRSGARVAICYDLGVPSERVRALLARADVLVLESNHDEGMLRIGPYPPSVKKRIASPLGHLSNRQSAALARTVVHRGLRRLVLAHLSESNNTPAVALAAMRSARAVPASVDTVVAPQGSAITVSRERGFVGWNAAAASQLPLEL